MDSSLVWTRRAWFALRMRCGPDGSLIPAAPPAPPAPTPFSPFPSHYHILMPCYALSLLPAYSLSPSAHVVAFANTLLNVARGLAKRLFPTLLLCPPYPSLCCYTNAVLLPGSFARGMAVAGFAGRRTFTRVRLYYYIAPAGWFCFHVERCTLPSLIPVLVLYTDGRATASA